MQAGAWPETRRSHMRPCSSGGHLFAHWTGYADSDRISTGYHGDGDWVLRGVCSGGSFLCFEILSHHATFFRPMTAFPDMWPQARTYLSMGTLPSHFLNHRMAALAIPLWPWLSRLFGWVPRAGDAACCSPAWAVTPAVAASEHATSTLAMATGACVVAVSCGRGARPSAC